MKAIGFSLERGPLGHLHDEHVEQGKLVLELEKALSQRGPWGAGERRRLVQCAHALTTFERRHDLAPKHGELESALLRFNQTRALRWDGPWLDALAEALIAAHPT